MTCRAQTWVLLIVSAGLGAEAPRDPAEPPEVSRARKFIDLVEQGDYDAAVKGFDDTVRKALPPDKLKAGWAAVKDQFGKLKKQDPVRIEKTDKYLIVFVPCVFEKATIDAKIVFDKDGQITGLFFLPAAGEYKPPAYVKRDSFNDADVKFGKEEWALPGTLTIPKGGGPFAAIVLVHGSGPQDRDETVGPNKPFFELAGGLASQGIAVLRYDKRTLVHGPKIPKSLTVKEEVIDDCLAAVEMLRQRKEIDSKKIFVLGHSLGAMMAPRIGTADADIAGLVILAGPARPLEDLMLEQFTYLFSLRGELTDDLKAELEKIKKQVERIKDPKLAPDTPAEELLGVPGSYWLALRDYQPAVAAAKLKQPLLVLQGERDYQVTMADFAIWKKQLGDRKNVEFKSYAKLNHFMMAGEGKATNIEVLQPGHVDKDVVDDIARWIKKQ